MVRNDALAGEVVAGLKYDVLNNNDKCVQLADDFQRLMRSPEEDFRFIKEQSWYTRIWHTFGGSNLQKLAAGIQSLVQAQSLLMEIVRTMSANRVEGLQLLQLLSDDLDHVRVRQGRLEGHLSTIYDEISVLKQQLQYQKTMVLDENQLPEEIRVLILRAMIATAHVDKIIDEAESELICRKIDSMELSEKARRIVLSELSAPTPLKLDLRVIDSHKVRLLFYRNVAAIAAADGVIHAREQLLLDRLAKGFGVQKEDARRVLEDLLHLKSVSGLEMLISSVVNSFNKKEAEELARAKAEQEAETARAYELIVQEIAESWGDLIGKLAMFGSAIIQEPLLVRLRAYSAESEIIKALDFMNQNAIRDETLDAAERFCGWVNEGIDQALIRAFPFMESQRKVLWSESNGNRVSKVVVNEMSSGFHSLVQLSQLEANVRKCDEGTLSLLAECGLVGVGLGVLTGGLGFLAGAGYGWWKGNKKDEEAAAATEAYQNSLQSFANSFDEAVERSSERFSNAGVEYFDEVLIPALAEADVAYESLTNFQKILLAEQTEVERLTDCPGEAMQQVWQQRVESVSHSSTPLPQPQRRGVFSCSVCGKDPAPNYVNGTRYCNDCVRRAGA
jgi:uncharacterized membrane protein YebE (DUF533 family)